MAEPIFAFTVFIFFFFFCFYCCTMMMPYFKTMTPTAAIRNNNNKKKNNKKIKNSIWLLFSKIKSNWMIQIFFFCFCSNINNRDHIFNWLASFRETVYSHYLFILQCFVFFSRKLTNFLKNSIWSDSSVFHRKTKIFICKWTKFNFDLYIRGMIKK